VDAPQDHTGTVMQASAQTLTVHSNIVTVFSSAKRHCLLWRTSRWRMARWTRLQHHTLWSSSRARCSSTAVLRVLSHFPPQPLQEPPLPPPPLSACPRPGHLPGLPSCSSCRAEWPPPAAPGAGVPGCACPESPSSQEQLLLLPLLHGSSLCSASGRMASGNRWMRVMPNCCNGTTGWCWCHHEDSMPPESLHHCIRVSLCYCLTVALSQLHHLSYCITVSL